MLAVPALADDSSGNIGVGVQVGTLGVGPSLTYHVSQQLDVHAVYGTYTFNANVTSSSATYQSSIRLGGTAEWVDFAPGGGVFRISAGALENNLSVNATATPTVNGSFVFNGNTYTVADIGSVKGSITWPSFAPYVGIGFAPAHVHPHAGLSFAGSAGVAFVSTPTVTLTPTNSAAFATYPTLQTDLNAEKSKISSDLSVLREYPVLTIGLQYRF